MVKKLCGLSHDLVSIYSYVRQPGGYVRLEVTGELFSEAATEPQIDEALAMLTGEDGQAFAILSQSEMTYMQTSGWPDIGFDLEYQVGSLDNRYRCTNDHLTLEEISRSLKQYLSGDTVYLTALPWERDEMLSAAVARASKGRPLVWPLLLAVLALVALAIWYFL